MKVIIEARLESADPRLLREPIRLVSINRPDDDLAHLGLSLEEGCELMAAAQAAALSNHVANWLNIDNRADNLFGDGLSPMSI